MPWPRRLADRYGGRVVGHSRFGTAKWWIADVRAQLVQSLTGTDSLDPARLPESLDLISARTEFYEYPTALPTVERSSIKLDLHRRDFTINTMAMRLDGRHYGELYDYWGGLNDLRKGLVRVLHSLSFVDDPPACCAQCASNSALASRSKGAPSSSCMKPARYYARFPATGCATSWTWPWPKKSRSPCWRACRNSNFCLPSILTWPGKMSWRRSWGRRCKAQAEAAAWKLPEKVGHTPLPRALAYLAWLGSLPQDSSMAIASRLRLNGDIIDALQGLLDAWQKLAGLLAAPPSRVVSMLESTPVVSLYALYLLHPNGEIRRLLQDYALVWRNIQPETDGKTLLNLGIPPGPAYHHILETLRSAWLDGKINTSIEEKAFLQDLIRQYD